MKTYEEKIQEAAEFWAKHNVIGASAEAIIAAEEVLCEMRDQIAEEFGIGRQMVYYAIENAYQAM